MTISKYITELLNLYEKIEIETNHVLDGSDKYGLYKSPARGIKDFMDGSYEITENYQFLAKQKSVSESEREEAEEWLENLTYWADDFQFNYKFPQLGNGRTVKSFAITGNPYPLTTEHRETIYQMALSITYLREREDL